MVFLIRILLLAIAVSISTSIRANAQTGDGTITAVSGRVQVTHAGKVAATTVGMPVFNGDQVDTAAGSSATVTLLDTSTLEIGASSKIKLDIPTRAASTSTMARIGLLAGAVRSYVAHAVAGGPPKFEVNTPNAVAAARGTKYDVTYQEGVDRSDFKGCHRFTDVAVYDGSVEVANLANPANTVVVQPGYKSTVPCALAPTAASAIAASAGGLGAGAIAAGVLTGITGGVLGGYAAAGGFNGSNNSPPASPSK